MLGPSVRGTQTGTTGARVAKYGTTVPLLDLRYTGMRMATGMDVDSEVLFKEKQEEKGIKAEIAVDDATIRFDFRASTPAMPPPGMRNGGPRRGRRGTASGRIKKFQP